MLALGTRSPLMFGWIGGYRVLSLSLTHCSLRDGSNSQYTNINLVLGVLYGGIGAARDGFGVSRVCGGTQLGTNDRYDAAPQESLHPNTKKSSAGDRHVPLPLLRRARAHAEAARPHPHGAASALFHQY